MGSMNVFKLNLILKAVLTVAFDISRLQNKYFNFLVMLKKGQDVKTRTHIRFQGKKKKNTTWT